MKAIVLLTAWTPLAAVVLYGAVHPDHGVLYHNPLATLGAGLIGLGLCMNARRLQPSAA